MSNKSNRRQTVFIKKAFQSRLISKVFMLILLSGLCSSMLVYWFTAGDLIAVSQSAHENIQFAIDRLLLSIVIANVVAFLVAGVTTVVMVLYVSHKIAGPLHRFERICDEIGNDQLDTVTLLRKDDQLQDMGQAFSVMVDKLSERKAQRQYLAVQLDEQIELFQNDSTLTQSQQESIAQMRVILSQLSS